MDTGVRDLEVACFKANSTWINDTGRKDLSNRPIYAVLNAHNLHMILQLKYMLIVMNPARIASSDWKSYKCYGLCYALSSKRVRWPPIFFYVFNLILSFSTCSQSFNKICVWEVLGANVLKLQLAYLQFLIWRTTRSAPKTSCMIVRLQASVFCFDNTSPEKSYFATI